MADPLETQKESAKESVDTTLESSYKSLKEVVDNPGFYPEDVVTAANEAKDAIDAKKGVLLKALGKLTKVEDVTQFTSGLEEALKDLKKTGEGFEKTAFDEAKKIIGTKKAESEEKFKVLTPAAIIKHALKNIQNAYLKGAIKKQLETARPFLIINSKNVIDILLASAATLEDPQAIRKALHQIDQKLANITIENYFKDPVAAIYIVPAVPEISTAIDKVTDKNIKSSLRVKAAKLILSAGPDGLNDEQINEFIDNITKKIARAEGFQSLNLRKTQEEYEEASLQFAEGDYETSQTPEELAELASSNLESSSYRYRGNASPTEFKKIDREITWHQDQARLLKTLLEISDKKGIEPPKMQKLIEANKDKINEYILAVESNDKATADKLAKTDLFAGSEGLLQCAFALGRSEKAKKAVTGDDQVMVAANDKIELNLKADTTGGVKFEAISISRSAEASAQAGDSSGAAVDTTPQTSTFENIPDLQENITKELDGLISDSYWSAMKYKINIDDKTKEVSVTIGRTDNPYETVKLTLTTDEEGTQKWHLEEMDMTFDDLKQAAAIADLVNRKASIVLKDPDRIISERNAYRIADGNITVELWGTNPEILNDTEIRKYSKLGLSEENLTNALNSWWGRGREPYSTDQRGKLNSIHQNTEEHDGHKYTIHDLPEDYQKVEGVPEMKPASEYSDDNYKEIQNYYHTVIQNLKEATEFNKLTYSIEDPYTIKIGRTDSGHSTIIKRVENDKWQLEGYKGVSSAYGSLEKAVALANFVNYVDVFMEREQPASGADEDFFDTPFEDKEHNPFFADGKTGVSFDVEGWISWDALPESKGKFYVEALGINQDDIINLLNQYWYNEKVKGKGDKPTYQVRPAEDVEYKESEVKEGELMAYEEKPKNMETYKANFEGYCQKIIENLKNMTDFDKIEFEVTGPNTIKIGRSDHGQTLEITRTSNTEEPWEVTTKGYGRSYPRLDQAVALCNIANNESRVWNEDDKSWTQEHAYPYYDLEGGIGFADNWTTDRVHISKQWIDWYQGKMGISRDWIRRFLNDWWHST